MGRTYSELSRVKKWETYFKTDPRGKEIFACTKSKNKQWGNEYTVAQRVCGISMFNNDNFHEGSHQIAAKKRPLIIDETVMNQQMYNFFICTAETLEFLFQVATTNTKPTTDSEDKNSVEEK